MGRYKKLKQCPVSECGQFLAPQGMKMHLRKRHPDYKPPVLPSTSKKEGEDHPDEVRMPISVTKLKEIVGQLIDEKISGLKPSVTDGGEVSKELPIEFTEIFKRHPLTTKTLMYYDIARADGFNGDLTDFFDQVTSYMFEEVIGRELTVTRKEKEEKAG